MVSDGMTGLLNPKPSKNRHLFCMILVVYLSHEVFHLVWQFIFFLNQFLGEFLSSQIEEYIRKTQWLVHLYRSRRVTLLSR